MADVLLGLPQLVEHGLPSALYDLVLFQEFVFELELELGVCPVFKGRGTPILLEELSLQLIRDEVLFGP